jgi:cardiolipin synthase
MESDLLYAWLAAFAVVLLYITAVICIFEALLKSRTAQGSIAWVLSLITLPWFSVPAYLIFGRSKFAGYLERREEIESEARLLIERTGEAVEAHLVGPQQETPLSTRLFNITRMPATDHNRVELLIDGHHTFESIATGLEAAQKYIFFQFYILRDDELGLRLCRILMDRARAGVRVFVLFDEIGSRPFDGSKLMRQMQTVGVKVAPFNTTQGWSNPFQLNFRNHRKVVVVDGLRAWIGGHNVGDEYLGLDRKMGAWRDTHTVFEGPSVLGAELAFATDWRWATGQHLDVDWDFARPKRGDSRVLVFPSDPASNYEEVGLLFHHLIVEAKERVWIATPYFVPDRAIISALQLAALRGVDVRIILPEKSDGPIVGLANWAFTRELLPVGVRFYRYCAGFLHQKVLLMDRDLASVGTANFDNRSIRLNFEITLLVEGDEFADEVERMLQQDMLQCREVTPAEIAKHPLWFRLLMAAARLLSPVL